MLYTLYLALAAFIVSLVGTRGVIQALRQKQVLIDRPNARSNHRAPVPRGGGMAVVITLGIFLMQADVGYGVIGGLFLLAIVSLIDDWITLSPGPRLIAQFIAVLAAMSDLKVFLLLPEYVPLWLAHGVVAIVWIWFINLFNFMDGIDGLAASEVITIAGGIALILTLIGDFSDPLASYSLLVMAAAAGFLWWNWHPAKIFLGDVGSIPLGFICGYLLLCLAGAGFPLAALILPAYFIADATYTLTHRLLRGKKIWVAHSEHAYQKAVRGGRAHDRVTRMVFGINLLLILLAIFAHIYPGIGVFCVIIAYATVAFIMHVFSKYPHHLPESPNAEDVRA